MSSSARLRALITAGGVAIGQRLAENLGLRIGDKVKILIANGAQTPFGVTPRSKVYPVTAIFQIGMAEFDNLFVYMALPEAQAFFNKDNEASVIEIFLRKPEELDAVRSKIEGAVMRPMIMVDWRERNKTFFDALNVERNVMFIILTLIVLVAALNIVSGLIMLVKDKGPDIAILRTMGATQGGVMRIFLITGASIGVAGTLAGCLLGLLVATMSRPSASCLNWLLNANLFPAELYFLSRLPSVVEPQRCPRCCRDDAHAFGAGDDLSLLARGEARSRRSFALRIVMSPPVLRLERIERRYDQAGSPLEILRGADFCLWAGQSAALVAPSGAGKSTLLHIAGLLEKPDAGEVFIAGEATVGMDDAARTALRRGEIGFVYQFHHLCRNFRRLKISCCRR